MHALCRRHQASCNYIGRHAVGSIMQSISGIMQPVVLHQAIERVRI